MAPPPSLPVLPDKMSQLNVMTTLECPTFARSAPSSLMSAVAKPEPILLGGWDIEIQSNGHERQGDEYLSTAHSERIVTQSNSRETNTASGGPERSARENLEKPDAGRGKHHAETASAGHVDTTRENQHISQDSHVVHGGVVGGDAVSERSSVGADEVGW